MNTLKYHWRETSLLSQDSAVLKHVVSKDFYLQVVCARDILLTMKESMALFHI